MKCVTGIRTLADAEKAVKFLGCRTFNGGTDAVVKMRDILLEGDGSFYKSLYVGIDVRGRLCLFGNYSVEDRSIHEVYNVKDLKPSSFMERHNERLK